MHNRYDAAVMQYDHTDPEHEEGHSVAVLRLLNISVRECLPNKSGPSVSRVMEKDAGTRNEETTQRPEASAGSLSLMAEQATSLDEMKIPADCSALTAKPPMARRKDVWLGCPRRDFRTLHQTLDRVRTPRETETTTHSSKALEYSAGERLARLDPNGKASCGQMLQSKTR
ncbi:hypothetical protein K458DRAFT_389056 [Lentithecium fluviatile CBS 122367]|uniref:Uncharacterized protein n=1 Tax=Lentithecium fluviatile CBS 122367 TaxID=1168545 RepID=A0A6G1J252_9PLEO|nr:hypothetical protein K458DRAFT_389056 [Lentithecium fluviatile CBS 122367]